MARAAALVVEQHLVKLLVGEDPFNVERLWDIMYRSTMPYGQAGIAINAISGVDLRFVGCDRQSARTFLFTNCSAARPRLAFRPIAPAMMSSSISSSATSG